MKPLNLILLAALTTTATAHAMGPRPPTQSELDQQRLEQEALLFEQEALIHDYFGKTKLGLTQPSRCDYSTDHIAYGPFNFRPLRDSDCIREIDIVRNSPEATAFFDLTSVSSNGKSYEAILTLRSEFLSQLLADRGTQVKVKYSVTLDSCDGQNIITQSTSASLEDLIAGFQETDFRQFLQCKLRMVPRSSDNRLSPVVSNGAAELSKGSLYAQSNGNIVIDMTRGNSDENERVIDQLALSRSARVLNPEKAKRGLDAAKTFIGLIKAHGTEIIRAASADATPQERKMIVDTSLRMRKPMILEALKTFNDNFSEMGLTTKFSATQSVNRAYDYVKDIEVRIGKLSDYSQRLNLILFSELQ